MDAVAEGSNSGTRWVGGILAAVVAGVIVWALTHSGGPFNPPPPGQGASPQFEVISANQDGSCTVNGGCPVIGTFRNNGGAGSGAVIFSLVDDTRGQSYGTCSADIPNTEHNGVSRASCTIISAQISIFLQSIPAGQHVNIPAHVTAEVKNPGG